MPSISWNGDSISAELYPIEILLGKNYGLPKLSNNCEILEVLQSLSQVYNYYFEIDRINCKGIIKEIKLK